VKSLLIPDSPHVSQWVDLAQKERANRNDECLLGPLRHLMRRSEMSPVG
jgi:hypothetical protein